VRQDNENQETRYNRQGLKKINIDGWNIEYRRFNCCKETRRRRQETGEKR
jgi:hypothetical protein